MGLASTGVECGRRGYPGVNTRVSAFRSWLDSTPAVYKPYEGNVTQQRASCPAGEFLNSFGGEPATCAVCPPGSVSPEGVSRACFSCPGNSSPDPFDFGKCSCRAVLGMGYVSSDGGGCEVCRPGTFSAFGSNRCADCRRGSYAKGSGNAECLPCPKAPRRSKRCPSA